MEELHQPLVVMLVRREEALTSLPETLISKLDVVEHLYMLCPQMMIVCLATQTKKRVGIWIYGSKEGQEDGQTEREEDRQRGRQTNRQADKQIDRRDRQTNRQRDRQKERLKEADRQTNKKIERQADRQTDGQKERSSDADRQTNRQIDRQANGQTDRQTNRRAYFLANKEMTCKLANVHLDRQGEGLTD